ncbi:hypothetical protein BD413DRAFT_78976 [Trametes elegans]|nr:hypothetical protein BD413DRAFT_78976 [Trametes elegans]
MCSYFALFIAAPRPSLRSSLSPASALFASRVPRTHVLVLTTHTHTRTSASPKPGSSPATLVLLSPFVLRHAAIADRGPLPVVHNRHSGTLLFTGGAVLYFVCTSTFPRSRSRHTRGADVRFLPSSWPLPLPLPHPLTAWLSSRGGRGRDGARSYSNYHHS